MPKWKSKDYSYPSQKKFGGEIFTFRRKAVNRLDRDIYVARMKTQELRVRVVRAQPRSWGIYTHI